MTVRTSHPHFNDQGTLDWHTRYAKALAVAQAEKKLVFIEMGREACGQCRSLVQAIVPRADVAPLLRDHFVALASDADDTEDEVIELANNLEDAYMLPFVMFTDAQGKYLGGFSGSVNPSTFLATLQALVQSK